MHNEPTYMLCINIPSFLTHVPFLVQIPTQDPAFHLVVMGPLSAPMSAPDISSVCFLWFCVDWSILTFTNFSENEI